MGKIYISVTVLALIVSAIALTLEVVFGLLQHRVAWLIVMAATIICTGVLYFPIKRPDRDMKEAQKRDAEINHIAQTAMLSLFGLIVVYFAYKYIMAFAI